MSQSRISIPNKSSGPRKQMEHMIVTAKRTSGHFRWETHLHPTNRAQ